MELLYTAAGIATLGLAFLGIERLDWIGWRRLGPWLLVLVLCGVVLLTFPPTLDRYSWSATRRYYFWGDMLGGFGFVVSFAVGAVLTSRVLLRVFRSPLAFLTSFVGATLILWLATLFVWSAILPGS